MNDLKQLRARFFKSVGGREPVRDWLLSLPDEDRKAIGDDIRTVEFGWPVGMPLCRPITGQKGLWEIRSSLSERRQDRPRDLLRSPGRNGPAGRFHQKGSAGTEDGDCRRGEENEGIVMNNDIERGEAGTFFEDFLREQGTLEDTNERAVKRVLAFQLAAEMEQQKISKVEMARRMNTSRSQVDRLLDPEYATVALVTLTRAAKAVGRTLRLELQ